MEFQILNFFMCLFIWRTVKKCKDAGHGGEYHSLLPELCTLLVGGQTETSEQWGSWFFEKCKGMHRKPGKPTLAGVQWAVGTHSCLLHGYPSIREVQHGHRLMVGCFLPGMALLSAIPGTKQCHYSCKGPGPFATIDWIINTVWKSHLWVLILKPSPGIYKALLSERPYSQQWFLE